MALKKSEKKLLMLLGVALLVFVVDKFILGGNKKKPKPAPTKTTTAAVQTVSAAKPPVNPVKKTTPGKAVQYETWGRDPFEIPGAPKITASDAEKALVKKHKLRGILWKEGKAFALIDDLVLTEGQEKGGIRLNRVRGNAAYCSKSGSSFTLQLEEKAP